MLISKHLAPGARRLADPPYVRRTEAYNNPLPASSASIRVVPPITAVWVESLAIEHLGHPPLRHMAVGGRLEPIMSDGRRFELLSFADDGESTTLVLLVWSAELGRGEVQGIDAEAEALGPLRSIEVDGLEVPPEVISELKGLGFVIPPSRVGLAWLRFAPLAPAEETDDLLRIVWHMADGVGEDVLNLRRVLPDARGGDRDKEDGEPVQTGESQ